MAKKSFFGRLAEAFKEPEEESSEDIDKDVEAAVMATMALEIEALEGETVLHPGTGDMGDTVYVLDLAPIYKKIGGRNSRAAAGLLEICDRQFDAFREHKMDIAVVKGDHFIMRFAKASNEEGYRRAALIINEVGFQVLSGQFQKMEVPELLVAADVNEIINDDGEVQTDKIADVQKKGGVPIDFRKLSGDVPGWAKLVVKKNAKIAWEFLKRKKKDDDIEMVTIKHDKAIKDDDVHMVEIKNDRAKTSDWVANAMKIDPSEKKLVKRSPADRRRKRMSVGPKERRSGGLDRRGRGH